ncbi:CAP domain-containing protein [Roseovarius ramblicola]|uniref:CAP domain-containing protein n=1 Tax=Roseovarius ramblicola TaxID=2022336 RepID=UPI00366B51A3
MRWLVLAVGVAGQAALAGGGTVDLGAITLAWINTVRAAEGRAPLAVSGALSRAAIAHARDMARTGRFGHAGRDGSRVSDRVRREGFGYCFVAENIAKGYATPEEALRGWMASRAHRRNLLDRRAAAFGLARGTGPVWVLVLGRDGC